MNHSFRSRARGRAIREIAVRFHVRPDGSKHRYSESALRAWIRDFETGGLQGLGAKRRADRGRRRVLVTRKWDKGVDLDAEARRAVAARLEREIRSLWAGLQPGSGWSEVRRHASTALLGMTVAAGSALPPPRLRELCAVTRSLVERHRAFQAAAVHDKDAKAYFDHRMPRIRRSTANLSPMQIVMGDVHPIDIQYRRADGSLATPKGIFWMDVATERLCCHPVFLPRGRGVRQEDVIGSFAAMARDAAWGCPGNLYLDNGGEYNWAAFVADAMKLSLPVFPTDGADFIDPARNPVTRAQPYNAPAKGLLEGAFGALERKYFSLIPGWIGGDRLRQKTANVGRAAAPFPGGEADLAAAIRRAVAVYNDTARGGRLGGLSPHQRMRRAVEAGWRPTLFRDGALESVFCRSFGRRIRHGAVRHGGTRYYHDALTDPMLGDRVEVRQPLFGDRDRIAVHDRDGAFVCIAEPDRPFDHDDPAGARESARRKTVARGRVRAMKRLTRPIDTLALLEREAALIEPPPAPEPGGVILFDDGRMEGGRQLAKSAAARHGETRCDEERRLREWDAVADRLLRANG